MTYLNDEMRGAVVPATAPHPSPARRLIPWLAMGSVVALLLRQHDARRQLGEVAGHALEQAQEGVQTVTKRAAPLVQQVQDTVRPAVSDALTKVAETAAPLAGAVAAQAKDLVRGVADAAPEAKQAIHHTRARAERAAEERKTTMDDKKEAVAAAVLAKQEKQLHDLQVQVNTLMRARGRSGGGFPWGVVLLAGGGYYLYRSNPTVRDQINGLLKRVNPGAEGNLARAGDAAKDAVGKVMHGEDPSSAVKDAGGELKRAGEKTLDAAGDKLQDLKQSAQDKAQDAKGAAQDLGRDVKNAAQDVKTDAQRAANNVKDDINRR